eukprot:scaffold286823_cov44-Attheya_sp.AAC.1
MGNSGNSHESSTFGSYEQPSQSQQQPLPPVTPHSTNHTTPNNNSTATTTSPRNGGGGFFRRHSGLSKFHISRDTSHDDHDVEQQQRPASPNSNSQGNLKTKRSLVILWQSQQKEETRIVPCIILCRPSQC